MFNESHRHFTVFSMSHMAAWLVLAACIVLLVAFRQTFKGSLDRTVRIVLVSTMLGLEWTFYIWTIRTNGMSLSLLPLGLCAMSLYLTCILLVFKSRRVFSVVFPWAIGGALISLLVADLDYNFPHFRYIHYFANHSLFLLSNLYMVLVWRFRYTYRNLLLSSAVLVIIAIIMYPINMWLGTNHLFLRELPEEVRPVYALFGTFWPVVFAFSIFMLFHLIYAPMVVVRRFIKEKTLRYKTEF